MGSLASRFIWMNLKVKLCAKRVVRIESVWLAIWFGGCSAQLQIRRYIGMEWPWASFRWLPFLLFPSPSEIVNGLIVSGALFFCYFVYAMPCFRVQFGWNHCEGINLWMERRIGPWLLTGRLVGNCSRRSAFAVIWEKQWEKCFQPMLRTMTRVHPMGKRLFNKTVHVRCLFSLFARTWWVPHPMKHLIWLHMPMLRCLSSLAHVCAPALQCATPTKFFHLAFAFVLYFFASGKVVLPIFLVSIVLFSAAIEESLHR